MSVVEELRNPDPEPNEANALREPLQASQDHQTGEPGSVSAYGPAIPKARVEDGLLSKRGRDALATGTATRTLPQTAPTTDRGLEATVAQNQPPVEPEPRSRRSSVSPRRAGGTVRPAAPAVSFGPPGLANGEDVLQLDLPERLEMIQLLDLAAEYLNLDYMCDLEKIRGQWVSLRLHGKLRGDLRVKDLYPLLESVLKFKGYAMTCHAGGLVTIVPVTDALQVDPVLVDPNSGNIEAGDMVVTRVFDLQYVNTASAMSLLESMKLSVAASPIEENRSLIVTCYAYRMARIERLLSMIDRPGRPKEFRFRQLQYTLASTLTKKVETLVAELKITPPTIAPAEQPKPTLPVLTVSAPVAAPSLIQAQAVWRDGGSGGQARRLPRCR